MGWLLAGLLVLLLGLLSVPWTARISFSRFERSRFDVRLFWGPFRIPESDDGAEEESGDGERESNPPESKARRRRDSRSVPFRKIRALLRSEDFVGSLIRLVERLLISMRPRHLRLEIDVGTGDPADTGRLFAALAPLVAFLGSLDADEVLVRPDFFRRRLRIDGSASVRVIPSVLLAYVVGYFFTVPPWRGLRRYLAA